jgi:hypothetical protein
VCRRRRIRKTSNCDPKARSPIQSENVTDPPPLPLESSNDADHVYQLRRHLTLKHTSGGALDETKAEVLEFDQKGTVLKRLVIYEHVRFEAAD